MMNLVGLLLQAFFDHQARTQADRFREAGLRAADKGRRVATTAAFYAVSGAFFFSGLLIAVIDLGLQIDRGDGVTFSGLMISATILILIGFLCVFIGWIAGRDPQPVQAAPQEPPRSSELRNLVEELAVVFLKDFTESQKARRARNASGDSN
ncbi:MAG TPA: hypothetical protein PL182_12960 [Pseudobdellovibrionaceae bacterium]|mgnify:CR=1 FL=1|nr:hypothetical protein [Pseudobdellovibrionaceae bacterium]